MVLVVWIDFIALVITVRRAAAAAHSRSSGRAPFDVIRVRPSSRPLPRFGNNSIFAYRTVTIEPIFAFSESLFGVQAGLHRVQRFARRSTLVGRAHLSRLRTFAELSWRNRTRFRPGQNPQGFFRKESTSSRPGFAIELVTSR